MTQNQDQGIRSRRLFHLIQQSFTGYPKVDNVVKSQIAFHGMQAANGFELLRLLRKEFSLLIRPEALQYREACLKFGRPTSVGGCLARSEHRSGELPQHAGGIFD